MAHMIPPKPKAIDERSNEGVVFSKFKFGLGDDYYVFHSVSEVEVIVDEQYFEREMDFVIAHRDKGVLCIEVKGGKGIQYVDRTWYYSNGTEMDHEGPYHQIASAKRTIRNKVQYHNNPKVRELFNKCRFFHAVMFADLSRENFDSLSGLPEEADSRITICAEDMISIEKKIDEIFKCKLPWEKYNDVDTIMNDAEFKLLLDSVLCPHFKLIPSPKAKHALWEDNMNQLLREQSILLDFLDEQDTAVINGAAGTGKTMLAVEKAKRHSDDGEKVLFLCYNRMLCDSLVKQYKDNENKDFAEQYENVDFMTISKLAKEKVGNFTDFDGLLEWLLECADRQKELGYQHIIVDEGQDFGLVDAKVFEEDESGEDNCSIIDALQEAALANCGTFYLFYDKYQMIQGGTAVHYTLPDCIENCDCRLTLHKNCRNTQEIARTSVTPLKDKKNRAIKPSTACSWEKPFKPVMHIIGDSIQTKVILDGIIMNMVDDGMKDIVILTPKTLDYSSIAIELEVGKDGYDRYMCNGMKYPVTTCIKFKGLEADGIIMIDLDKESFTGQKGQNFYVGTSRAKHRLEYVCTLSEDEYFDVVHDLDPNAPKRNNPDRMRQVLGNTFGADIEVH